MAFKRPFFFLWCAAFAAGAFPITGVAQTTPPGSSPAAATMTNTPELTIVVPRHTIIPILVDKDLRVGGAGDNQQTRSIKIEVAQDVIINGLVIAKAGDLAEGHLTTAKNITKRAFSTDISQEAALDIDDVVNFCGDTIHMQFERTYVGGVRGGFMSLGAHAHDAVFEKGLILKASSDRVEKAICVEKTTKAPLPLPADMVVPDEEVETK